MCSIKKHMKCVMNEPYKTMFKTPREACIFLLKREDSPLDPPPKARQKIEVDVGCSRWTVKRAIDDLIMSHVLLHGAEDLPLEARKKLVLRKEPTKQVLRMSIDILKSHIQFMFKIKESLERTLSPYEKVYYDAYETDRLRVIRQYCGLDIKEVEK